jgi:hypothetical protein
MLRASVLLLVACSLLILDHSAHASHPFEGTGQLLGDKNYLYRNLEAGGTGHITYSLCGSPYGVPSEWRTGVENWDSPLTLWQFDEGACGGGHTVLAWEGYAGYVCTNPGAWACWLDPQRHGLSFTSHGSHRDLQQGIILFDRYAWTNLMPAPQSEWRLQASAHEWGHNMSLADHESCNCAENTLMVNYWGCQMPAHPCYQSPTAADLNSVKCKVYGRCATIEGELVRGSGDPVYILSWGQKRHITSPSVLNACGYRGSEISGVADSTLDLIPLGSSVTAPPCPYTLVRVGSTDPVYVIWGSYFKRHITSPAAFNACGYDWGDIVSVSSVSGFTSTSDVNGPPCPYTRDPWYHEARMEGTLIQGSGDPVYILSGGQKRHISSASVLNACGYKRNDIVAVPDSTLSLIPTGSSITGPPCPYTLIRGTSDPDPVYVMTQTLKHHITSRSVFDGCGYIWGEIVTLSDALINSVNTGASENAPPCPYVRQ